MKQAFREMGGNIGKNVGKFVGGMCCFYYGAAKGLINGEDVLSSARKAGWRGEEKGEEVGEKVGEVAGEIGLEVGVELLRRRFGG